MDLGLNLRAAVTACVEYLSRGRLPTAVIGWIFYSVTLLKDGQQTKSLCPVTGKALCVSVYVCLWVCVYDRKQLYFKAMRKNSIIDRTWHLEDDCRQQQCENHFNLGEYEGNFDHRVIIVTLEAPFSQNLCDNVSAVATDNKASVPLSLCRHEVMEWVWSVLVCCHFWNPSSIF